MRATRAEQLSEIRYQNERDARTEANTQRKLAEANLFMARQAVDEMFTQVAEKWLSQTPGMTLVQKEFLEKAGVYYEKFARLNSTDPEMRQKTGEAYRRLARIYNALRRPENDEQAARQAVDVFRSLSADFPDNPAYRHELARSYSVLGFSISNRQGILEEESAHREATAIYEALVAEFPEEPEYRRYLAFTTNCLANTWAGIGRLELAEKGLRKALALSERQIADFPDDANFFRTAIGFSLKDLGTLLASRNPAEAEELLRRAVSVHEQLAKDFPEFSDHRNWLADDLQMLGNILRQTNRPQEAKTVYDKALRIREKLAADFPQVVKYRTSLDSLYFGRADRLMARGHFQEAEQLLRQIIALRQALVNSAQDKSFAKLELSNSYRMLGKCLETSGRLEDARQAYDRVAAILEELLGAEETAISHLHGRIGRSYNRLARQLASRADSQVYPPSRAVELAKKAIQLEPCSSQHWTVLGIAQYRARNWSAAISALKKRDELQVGGQDMDSFFLAMAQWKSGRKEAARASYQKAVRWMEKNSSINIQLLQFRSEAEQLLGIPAEAQKPIQNQEET